MDTLTNICATLGVLSEESTEHKYKDVFADDDTKTILDYFYANAERLGDRSFFTQPMGNGVVKEWTFAEVLADAKAMAGYIRSLQLAPNSKIAIISKNCSYWIIADLAIWMTGHVTVPVYPTLTADTTRYTLEHSESKLVFIGKLDEKPWEEMKQGIPDDLPTVSFPLSLPNSAQKSWETAMTAATPITTPKVRTPDEMATIIYTSGSTGKPKGVMTRCVGDFRFLFLLCFFDFTNTLIQTLSHTFSFKAMLAATKGIAKTLDLDEHDRYLSYLPVSHGMERLAGECIPLFTAEHVFFAESLKTFVADLNRCKPTIFLSVPRLWTKFQAGVFSKMSPRTLDVLFQIPIVSDYIKEKILKNLGLECVRFAGSGSAPIPKELIDWYRDLGLELLEAYGMTENFNYSHINQPGKTRVGYVGNTYPDVDCRISDKDGEIQVLTPAAMMGYYKNEQATKEAMTEDGWVRTGDKGEIDEYGRLKITGRTKEIFKTSKGKYVAPAPIENQFIAHSMVELACVGGRAQPQPHAIVQLSEDAKKLASAGGKAERKKMATELEGLLNAVNASIDGHERLDFLVLVRDDWSPENGFLTPTQKIKRATIEDAYSGNVDDWYETHEKVIWYGWE